MHRGLTGCESMKYGIAAVLLAGTLLTSDISAKTLQDTVLPEESFTDAAVFNVNTGNEPAVDPIGNSESYSAVVYNNRNGLPTSEANDIAETSDGFIWIGSYSGLVRYDGNTFERIESWTGIGNVSNLYVDSKDRLWVSTNDSGIAMKEGGTITMWGEEDGLRSLKASMICEDPKGNIYVSTATGIYVFDNELHIKPVDDPRIREMYVDVLRTGADGLVYGLSNKDDIFTLQDGKVVTYLSDDEYDADGVIQILPDPDEAGTVYLGTKDSRFYKATLTDRLTIIDEVNIDPLFGVMEIKKIGKRIWITGRNGIGILEGRTFHYLEDLPLNNSVGSMMMDYEGNLWFSSTRQGVMKLVPNPFSNLFERFGLEEQVVNSTCLDDGKLFIGTDIGLIVAEDDELLTEFPIEHAETASGEELEITDLISYLEGSRIRSIFKDKRGRLWFSTWRAVGLLCYDHGVITSYNVEDGLLSDHLRAVNEMSDGSILVAVTGGVNVIKDGKVTGSYGEEDGVVNPETLTVSEGKTGDILFGTDGGGIYIVSGKDESVRRISTSDGLSSGIVMRIKRDKKRNLFWIVTSNSISYMTDDYQVNTVKRFPYSNNFDLYENDNEEMWVLSSNGIYVLPTEQLISGEDINPIHYSMDNGLPCITTANSYSYRADNGDLYISGNSGVAKVNINRPVENVFDLKVSVPYVDADGERHYPDERGNFHLPSHIHKVTVYSHVFNYALTNPTVMYRLDGFDSEDVVVRRSELGPVDYTNLPGGTYRFIIKLKDSQGQTGKRFSVTIMKEKALYEQPRFYVAVVLASAALLGTLIWTYLRKKTEALEKKNREEVREARLNTELKTAGQIQESMLPHTFPPFPGRNDFEIFASMTPAREVGGDFYDFFLIDDDHLCMVMADVSGKGIPAALFMMTAKAVLQNSAIMGQSAAEILTSTNEALCANNQVEMFVTVWVGILDLRTGKVSAANAGHEYPAVMKKGRFELLKDPHGFVVGGMEGVRYREYEFELSPGDKLFLYTDGVPEATDANNNMFGTERMLEALNRCSSKPPKRILKEVRKSVDEFVKDAEQFDDLTMMCITYNGRETTAPEEEK